MEDDPHEFLGSNITERNTPADHFKILKDNLEVKLENLKKTVVRGEYKVAVYCRYILPSHQFNFSVHSIHTWMYLMPWPGSFSRLVSPSLNLESQTWAFPPKNYGIKIPFSGIS